MSIELVEVTKNTRGINSREIKYKAIGKYKPVVVDRESKPEFNADGTAKLDDKGNQVRTPLGKDSDGKQITYREEIQEFYTDGVVTSLEDALELITTTGVSPDSAEQVLLDCFAEGFNERQYAIEANKDELDEFLSAMSLDKEANSVLKRTIRALNRGAGVELFEAAEYVKANYLKKLAAAQAAEAAKAQTVTA